MSTSSDIRANALAALKLSGSAMPAAANTIDLYDGEAQEIAQIAAQLTGAPPMCLVCYGGSTFTGFSGSRIENFTLLLIYVARHTKKAERMNQIDAMKDAALEVLMENNLGLNINPLVPGPVRMQLVTREYSVYSHQFGTFFAL